MNENRKRELSPTRQAHELVAMRALGALLLALGEQCAGQPGAVAWTLMQTTGESGRRGFQIFVMNHETGEYLWHRNALTFGELATALAEKLEAGG